MKKHELCKDCLIQPACDLFICLDKVDDLTFNTSEFDYVTPLLNSKCPICNEELQLTYYRGAQRLTTCQTCKAVYKSEELISGDKVVVLMALGKDQVGYMMRFNNE